MAERITVRCEVREYPDNDRPYQTLYVRNHWNRRNGVVLEIDGKSYTFLASDLEAAIAAALKAH